MCLFIVKENKNKNKNKRNIKLGKKYKIKEKC